jgi:hypothetical protein
MTYTHLFLDIIAGLKNEGWKDVGGNYHSYRVMRKGDIDIKVFVKYDEKFNDKDFNFICVRHI